MPRGTDRGATIKGDKQVRRSMVEFVIVVLVL
jgi:hypothetical protein